MTPEVTVPDTPPKRVGKMKAASDKLRAYGLAGVLAYGVMNQLYYSAAFVVLWLGPIGAVAATAPATAGLGATVAASTKQFGKVVALVWVGSQATKPLRYLLALLFAPAAEILLTATQKRLRLATRRRAFFLLCGLLLTSTASICTTAVAYAAVRTATLKTVRASSAAIGSLFPFRCAPPMRSSASSSNIRSNGGTGETCSDVTHASSPPETHGLSRCGHGRKRLTRKMTKLEATAADNTGYPRSEMEGRYRPAASDTTRLKNKGARARVENKTRKKRTPQKAADRYPPPQDNIHGWQEHPKHLLGFWKISPAQPLPAPQETWAPEAVAAAAPSVAAAAVLAAAASVTSRGGGSSRDESQMTSPRSLNVELSDQEVRALEIEGGFGDRETAKTEALDLGSDILHHLEYVVLKKDGSFKAGPARLGVVPRAWRFAPANRRLLFEVDVPGRGVALRYTAKLTRVPSKYTIAEGLVRVRPMSDATGETELPTSSRKWPKLTAFDMAMQLKKRFRQHESGD
ncbi:unnamed protein product [Sphacelaria rigidula]